MNQLTEYRREFHKYPENGWREFRTSARVAEILTGMGYDVAMGPDVIEPGSVGEPERLSEEQIRQEMERAVRQGADPAFVKRTQGWPGVMAVLDTGREGPVSAMRFEMDCLPYDEPQRPGYRPCDEGYLSCNPQSVHACGHDGHTAIGLGIAAELMKRKGELKGKIKLFFQPAEETGEGGNPCSRLLEELGADRVYGFHNLPGYPLGTAVMRRETFSCDTVNTPEITDMSRMLFEQEGIPCLEAAAPFRWSEDFGWYLKKCQGMYFGIGAGEDCPDLHTPEYEFPDEVIRNAVRCLYLLAEI